MPSAIDYGLLVMYAEDLYSAQPGTLAPTRDPHTAPVGWTIVGYLTAQDSIIPQPGDIDRTLGIDPTKRVFYGFVARNDAAPTTYVAAIRGTEEFVEWVIDAEFLLIPHPRHQGCRVEQGFWGIYQTMSLADPTNGVTTNQNAAEGVAALVGAGSLVVAGHSLGSAIATYFTDDLAERIGAQVSACLFASPQTGDAAWVALFDAQVRSYQLFNYILDLVPRVPSVDYATLARATVIQPSTAQAKIALDLLCNHHVLCYCAMIDYNATMAAAPLSSATGVLGKACVLGPADAMPDAAEGLATVIDAFGLGDARAVALLKALHPDATIKLASPRSPPARLAAASPPPAT